MLRSCFVKDCRILDCCDSSVVFLRTQIGNLNNIVGLMAMAGKRLCKAYTGDFFQNMTRFFARRCVIVVCCSAFMDNRAALRHTHIGFSLGRTLLLITESSLLALNAYFLPRVRDMATALIVSDFVLAALMVREL